MIPHPPTQNWLLGSGKGYKPWTGILMDEMHPFFMNPPPQVPYT